MCLPLVPTAPPQGVEVKAMNSITIEFTWNPPPQQFINGINQGYKVTQFSATGFHRVPVLSRKYAMFCVGLCLS